MITILQSMMLFKNSELEKLVATYKNGCLIFGCTDYFVI